MRTETRRLNHGLTAVYYLKEPDEPNRRRERSHDPDPVAEDKSAEPVADEADSATASFRRPPVANDPAADAELMAALDLTPEQFASLGLGGGTT